MTDIATAPTGGPVHLGMPRLSHSQLTTYMDCGEKYRLVRRHGMADSISWALVGGSVLHSWTEVYDMGLKVAPSYFLDLFEKKIAAELASDRNTAETEADIKPTGYKSKEWPNKRDRSWWEHHGPIFCQKYIDWRESPMNEVMPTGSKFETELKVEGRLGGLDVLGYIDRLVLESPFGDKPLILDVKSGRPPKNVLQLATYAVLASEQLGIEIKHGAFYLAEDGEASKIHDLSKFTREYIESLYEQARRGIAAGVFLPNPLSFCGSCPVKKFCGLYGNDLPLDVPLLEDPID